MELRSLPELLEKINQAERAALYRSLGLSVRYRRVDGREEVGLTSTLEGVQSERLGGPIRTRGPSWCCARNWCWQGLAAVAAGGEDRPVGRGDGGAHPYAARRPRRPGSSKARCHGTRSDTQAS